MFLTETQNCASEAPSVLTKPSSLNTISMYTNNFRGALTNGKCVECQEDYLKKKKENQSVRRPCGIVANVLDCNITVTKFNLQSCYYIYFWTNTFEKVMNSLISQDMG